MLVADLFRLRAAQKIDDIAHAKALSGAVNSTQRFLGNDGAVKPLECSRAVVAIAAVFVQVFGKIIEQKPPSTGPEITEFAHCIELLQHDLRLPRVPLDLGKAFQLNYIGPAKK